MKKTLFLSLVLVATMVMACGQSQEEIAAEIAAQEQLTTDSIIAFELTQVETEELVAEVDSTIAPVE